MANGDFLKYVSGKLQEVFAIVTSAGAGDAGKMIKLNSGGKLDITLLPTGVGADTQSVASSENLSSGDLVNVYDNSGTLNVRKADGTDPTKRANGFVLAAVTAPAAVTVYFEGINDQVSDLTPGADLYLSAAAAGGVVETAPSADGNIAQHVGHAISATSMYFSPTGVAVVRANDA